jgi:NitT/TauT family transport system substrate-binding protein
MKPTYPTQQLVLPFGIVPMRAVRTLITCCLAAVAGLSLSVQASRAEAPHPLAVELSFDRPVNAGEAPVILAMTDGLFAAEGLAVTTGVAAGSPEAIARVASGASELALVDLNALIRFHSQASAPVKAVFVLFNKSPYAILARKSRGIHILSDINGKTLGIADSDLSAGLWPALARQNGIHLDHVKQSPISTAVREPMLSAGQVDAVTGFS